MVRVRLRLGFRVTFHRRLLGHRVGGLLPDIVVNALSPRPHELELEFAWVRVRVRDRSLAFGVWRLELGFRI